MNDTAYNALRHGAAWIDLSDRGKIRVTGEDRVRLLHAMTTNNVQQLEPWGGCYAFLLNVQGRILADVNLFVLPEYILLDSEPDTRQRIIEHLDKFIIADDVTLEDVTSQMATLAIGGPKSDEVIRQLGAPISRSECGIAEWGTRLVACVRNIGGAGLFVFLPTSEKEDFISELERAGVVAADRESFDLVRLEHHRPRYGVDFGDTWIPQETQQMQAVHFAKGCYLGQEIVERVRARGHLNKMLVPLEIDSEQAPTAQTRILADGKDAGYVTSAAYSPTLMKVVALGMLRTDASGKTLTVNDAPATATNLPAATAKH
jgi:folate-binding protein YgfZ